MKEIFIINNEEELEYVSTIDENEVKLRYSNSDIWTSHTKGTDIGTLKDTGNGIKIRIKGIKTTLDYSAFCNLYRLLDLKVKSETNLMNEVKYVDETNLEL